MTRSRSSHMLILLLVLLAVQACEINKYKNGEQLFSQNRYAAAIEQLDRYIRTGNNGAYVTRAELLRSSCYYELGMAAVEKENWTLAIRLLKLADSDLADLDLARVYKNLALEAMEQDDIPRAMTYYSLILNETANSELIPEIRKLRIEQYLNFYDDKISAWNEYMLLFDNYPNDENEIAARPLISSFISQFIDAAVSKAIKKDFAPALEELFQIRRYPVGNQDRIDLEISNIYQEQAEMELQKKEYAEANRLFLKALQYYPNKKEMIDQRLETIADLYIDKGDDYLRVRDFDNALIYYQKSFEIIQNYPLGVTSIRKLNKLRDDINTAAKLYEEAQIQEMNRNYAEARSLYSQAYALDNVPIFYEKSVIMSNILEAEKNPTAFARSIINNYKGGLLNSRIQATKLLLLKKYNKAEVKDTGWKILLSSGQYKYEARYDLITPSENLYYVWQVNLKDRSIVPLNKISDALMQ